MTLVAIHQPNYFPWLGYFHKIAVSHVFVLLDDVQFPKGSFTNRVQIGPRAGPRWLTEPACVRLGMTIQEVGLVKGWQERHRRILHEAYRDSAHFNATWKWVDDALGAADGNCATVNGALLRAACDYLSINTRIELASLAKVGAVGTERLIALVRHLGGTAYLSGKGGAKYQDDAAFATAGIELRYSSFKPQPYPQWEPDGFNPGLSILDALFHVGRDRTRWLFGAHSVVPL